MQKKIKIKNIKSCGIKIWNTKIFLNNQIILDFLLWAMFVVV